MDEGLSIELEPRLADRLKARAEELGLTPNELALQLIEQRLLSDAYEWEEGIDPDPAIDEQIAAETICKGDGVPLDEALREFRTDLKRALAKRA